MKRPTVFITYFQSSVQFVHVYQVLLSEFFFQKYGGCFSLISIFPCLNNFCKETYEKTYHLFSYILKFPVTFYTFTKFYYLNIFIKKMGALSKCKQVFTYLGNFGSLLATLVHYFGNFGSLLAEGTANTWWILLHNDRKSRHRRIKKTMSLWTLVLGPCQLSPLCGGKIRQDRQGRSKDALSRVRLRC